MDSLENYQTYNIARSTLSAKILFDQINRVSGGLKLQPQDNYNNTGQCQVGQGDVHITDN